MRKNLTNRMKSRDTAAEVFELFLLTKRADGVKPSTLETYKQHFHAISKHLEINQEIAEMTATDLKTMIVSMQDSGLAPNSIKSYSITLKAFLSWCNAEGMDLLACLICTTMKLLQASLQEKQAVLYRIIIALRF